MNRKNENEFTGKKIFFSRSLLLADRSNYFSILKYYLPTSNNADSYVI